MRPGSDEMVQTVADRTGKMDMEPAVISRDDLLVLKKQYIKSKETDAGALQGKFRDIVKSLEAADGVGDYRVICCDTLSIWLLRATQAVQREKAGEIQADLGNLLDTDVANFLFKYVIDFWNESGAPLGNSLKDMFLKLVTFLNSSSNDGGVTLFTSWLVYSLDNCPITARVLYFMVETLVGQVPSLSTVVITSYSNFIKTSISYMWSNALANPVAKALKVIFKSYYHEVDQDVWLSSWDQLVVNNMRSESLRKNIQNYLLPSLFQQSPECFKIFVKSLVTSNNPDDLSTMLISLRIGHELAIAEEPFEGDDKIISIELLSDLISSDQSFYRIESLSLMTLSPKGSKPISRSVLDLVLAKLDVFLTETELETRNDFVSLFKKFILRLRDSTYAIHKKSKNMQAKNKFPEEVQEGFAKVAESEAFLRNLVVYLTANMKPGVSFQRCSMALKLLIILLKSGIDGTVDKSYHEKLHMDYPFNIEIYHDPKVVRLLVDNITNDFEEVRELCVTILSMSSVPVKDLISAHELDMIVQRSFEMLGDLKGRKADAGAKVLQFLFFNGYNKAELLARIVKDLSGYTELAKKDMTFAVYEANIHGYYLALNSILVSVKDSSDCLQFVPYLETVLVTILDVWQLTKPILSHDSPEGNLPLDLQKAIEPSRKHLETKFGPATQVILSYSWRAVKESTALLSTLLSKFSDEEMFADSKFTLNDIGELIIDQLSTIRHPGAFSSVYPTFVSCCNRCFRLGHADLPELWLEKNISLIQDLSHSITRRSGGLPFLITAILTAELNHVKKSRARNEIPPLFGKTFGRLYDIASQPFDESSGEETLDLPQVHALNSIKSLFIESQLSDLCGFYVDKSLDLALARFSTSHWSIRNASVMLFTALQNRLFGTKKIDKNHLSTIPARLFFSRYKSLHQVLMKNFANALSNDKEVENLFPILTILSRLHASPGYNPMMDFKPLLLSSLQNRFWKVREMAARALPSIVDDDAFYDQILELVQTIQFDNSNQIQGHFFAIKELLIRLNLRKGHEDSRVVPEEVCNALYGLVDKVIAGTPYAAIVYIEILDIVFERTYGYKDVPADIVCKLGNFFITENVLNTLEGGKQLQTSRLSTLLHKIYFNSENYEDLIDVLQLGLYSPLYECQLSAISFISQIVDKLDYSTRASIAEILWLILDSDSWTLVKASSLFLLKELLIANDFEAEDLLAKASVLFKFVQDPSEDVRATALECCGPFVAKIADELVFVKWNDLIQDFSKDEVSYHLRLGALNSCVSYLRVQGDYRDAASLRIWLKVYQFLYDDDDEIRAAASSVLSKDLMHLDFDLLSVEAEKKFYQYAVQNFDKTQLSATVFDIYMEKLKGLKLEIIDETFLFNVEKDNFYKNIVDEFQFYARILDSVSESQKLMIDEVISSKAANVSELLQFEDGILGLFRNDDYFNFVYVVLMTVKAFDLHNTDILSAVAGKSGVHPLLKDICAR